MKHFMLIIFLILLFGCGTSRYMIAPEPIIENEQLDTLVVRAHKIILSDEIEPDPYRASATREIDLIHTRLEISFDWTKRSVIGKAWLECKPFFYSIREFKLDARNFNLGFVGLDLGKTRKKLEYEYDGLEITIHLDRYYSKEEQFIIWIEYEANPEENSSERAFAIRSDQGMFFIDPDEKDPSKPTQIWTQGETSYNSRWFPTVDEPNERCTQEIFVTVDDRYISLSNGVLVNSTPNSDHTRTDHWKMDLPHAPYLFSLVVGNYAVIKERWRNIELGYYVYPEFADSGREIFNHTPEMLDFFSQITGVDFPWPRFSQVIVEDFVSGAMENTTAVTFAEDYQKSREDLVDFPNDLIVAHELSHHWFGNLVTCESWANLTLNEGFANYAEYLWLEYKYGEEEAQFHLDNEMSQYISGSNYQSHPLIHFEYEDKDGMFDVHSYNKGGLVLHMLRKYLGDDAFFAGMHKYLADHAYSSVEAHDLRLAFESVCGEDLNWFFNQWFFGLGYPKLAVSHQFEPAQNVLNVSVLQTQGDNGFRDVFSFPLAYQLIFENGTVQTGKIWIDEQEETVEIACDQAPMAVLFNSDHDIICTINTDYSQKQYAAIFEQNVHVVSRYDALINLKFNADYNALFELALSDSFSNIRKLGLDYLNKPYSKHAGEMIREMAAHDPDSKVRAKALRLYLAHTNHANADFVKGILKEETAASVISVGLNWLRQIQDPEALDYAEFYRNSQSHLILTVVADVFSQSGDTEYLPFFRPLILTKDMFKMVPFLAAYEKLLARQNPDTIMKESEWLFENIRNMEMNPYKKSLYYTGFRQQLENLRLMEKDPTGLREIEKANLNKAIHYLEKIVKD